MKLYVIKSLANTAAKAYVAWWDSRAEDKASWNLYETIREYVFTLSEENYKIFWHLYKDYLHKERRRILFK